jgi:hypothetical protein
VKRFIVMAWLGHAIHVFFLAGMKDVGGRAKPAKPGHDDEGTA